MNQEQAYELVKQTFESDFDRQRFGGFINHLLKNADFSKHFMLRGSRVYRVSQDKVSSFERLAQFTDVDGKKIDVLIVNLSRIKRLMVDLYPLAFSSSRRQEYQRRISQS